MTVAGFLAGDIATTAGSLRAGFSWWTAELAAMVPASLRGMFAARPTVTAEPLADGIRLMRRGVVFVPPPGREAQLVTLLLPRDQMLIRSTVAPPLPDRDVRRMLALDIDRLTPFRADEVFVAIALNPGSGAEPRQGLVAAIPRGTAAALVERLTVAGLEPRAVAGAGAAAAALDFDFSPVFREAGLLRPLSPVGRILWLAVAALLVANVVAAIVLDAGALDDLREAVAAQQPEVDRLVAVRRWVQAEDAARAGLAERRATTEPLRRLDTLSRVLPDGAWVERLSLDDRSLRLTGFRQDDVDVAAVLRRLGSLANVRDVAGDTTTREAGRPFDITADLIAVPRPVTAPPR